MSILRIDHVALLNIMVKGPLVVVCDNDNNSLPNYGGGGGGRTGKIHDMIYSTF